MTRSIPGQALFSGLSPALLRARLAMAPAERRAVLGEAAFGESAEKGRSMNMEQAIAYALEDI